MKKPSVSIAIPAYNEETMIESVLLSLVAQKAKKISLTDITIYSDNSTDKTHAIVRSLAKKYTLIKLKASTQRIGKYYRMGQMFAHCTSDALVVLDADIAIVQDNFLEKLVEVLVKDPKATMVAAHQKLIRPKDVMGKILHTHFVLWDFVRWSVLDFQNANNFYGSATAFRGSFARSIKIPKNLTDPHLYLYLLADKVKGFRYTMNAVILQQSISTWSDFEKFLDRPLGKKDEELEKITGVDSETVHLIPWKYKIKGILRCFLWQPIYTFPALALVVYMKIRPAKKTYTSSLWKIVKSTKKPISHEN